ncbi:MAG: hypothetical protein BWY82_02321 [Verrucomicrobia bacterium ADurb.Bin474]|nr:MAG: hypothetical protein BWY82_02321 [Verrucomicrobia bacterium ADurb.Bin474]
MILSVGVEVGAGEEIRKQVIPGAHPKATELQILHPLPKITDHGARIFHVISVRAHDAVGVYSTVLLHPQRAGVPTVLASADVRDFVKPRVQEIAKLRTRLC